MIRVSTFVPLYALCSRRYASRRVSRDSYLHDLGFRPQPHRTTVRPIAADQILAHHIINHETIMSSPTSRRSQRSSQAPTPRRTAIRNSQRQGQSDQSQTLASDSAQPNGEPSGTQGRQNGGINAGSSSPLLFHSSPEQQLAFEQNQMETSSPVRQASSVNGDGDRTPRAGGPLAHGTVMRSLIY